jgi:hypothetical protein
VNATTHDARPKRSVKRTLLILFGIYLAGLIALIAIYGFKGQRNNIYKPQDEFKLENWVNLGIFSINKAGGCSSARTRCRPPSSCCFS